MRPINLFIGWRVIFLSIFILRSPPPPPPHPSVCADSKSFILISPRINFTPTCIENNIFESSYSFRKLYYFILLSRLSFVSSFEYVCANGSRWVLEEKESKILNRTITKLNTHPTNINKTKAFSFSSLISAGAFSLLLKSFSYVRCQLQQKMLCDSHTDFPGINWKGLCGAGLFASETFTQTWSSAFREMLRNRCACNSKINLLLITSVFLHKRRKVQRVLMITVIFFCLRMSICKHILTIISIQINTFNEKWFEREGWRCVRRRELRAVGCRNKEFLVVCSTNIGSPGKRLRTAALRDLHNKAVIACKSFAKSARQSTQATFLQNRYTLTRSGRRGDCCRQTIFSLFQFFRRLKRSWTFNNSSYVECGSEWKLILKHYFIEFLLSYGV